MADQPPPAGKPPRYVVVTDRLCDLGGGWDDTRGRHPTLAAALAAAADELRAAGPAGAANAEVGDCERRGVVAWLKLIDGMVVLHYVEAGHDMPPAAAEPVRLAPIADPGLAETARALDEYVGRLRADGRPTDELPAAAAEARP